MKLTAVFVEDVGEAVQEAVATAAVGAALLNPLAVRNQPAAPAQTQRREGHNNNSSPFGAPSSNTNFIRNARICT